MSQPAKPPIVLKNSPATAESVVLGMGCFWGAINRLALSGAGLLV